MTLGVKEINKAPNTRCSHLCGKGCGVYATRPASCASFTCPWLANPGFLHGRDRPDRLGVMFTIEDSVTDGARALGIKADVVVARELRAGAFKTPRWRDVSAALKKNRLHVVTVAVHADATDGVTEVPKAAG